MKKALLICFFVVCSAANSFSQGKELPKLTGPYLGQKLPGMTPELFAPGIVSSGSHDLNITVSPDLKEIYITRSGPDWFSAILVFKQTESGWTGPKILRLPGVFESHYPFVSPDGKHLYFNASQQSAEETEKTDRIWIADRDGNEISKWRMLDSEINSDGNIMFPSVAADGTIYFSSSRASGLGRFDIYKSVLGQNGRGKAKNLGGAINSEDNEFHAYIAPDQSYIIFDSPRAGGYGRNDLYISYRSLDGGWTASVNMGPSVNTVSGEQRPYVSPDGKYLFFCSDRPNPQVRATDKPLMYVEFVKRIDGPGNGFQDIYWIDARIIEELRSIK